VKPALASSDSALELAAITEVTSSGTAADTASDVLALFDCCAPQMLRYVSTFGLGTEETEDIVQDAFLALFRHVRLGRDQANLPAWLFQVAHNLALKRQRSLRRRPPHSPWTDALAARHVDPTLDPEAQFVDDERRRRLRAVVNALPEREQECLRLRAAGLTYRDIAHTLRMSLGTVAKALTSAMSRLVRADGG
jgi:RNA polymerase sigma-70 factor, ECF subfamily